MGFAAGGGAAFVVGAVGGGVGEGDLGGWFACCGVGHVAGVGGGRRAREGACGGRHGCVWGGWW